MHLHKIWPIAAMVLLLLGLVYISLQDFSGWQAATEVTATAGGKPDKESKTDKKRDRKIDYFYQNNMKDYYCRDFLKTSCQSTGLLVNPISSEMEHIYDGGKLYLEYCARCHGDSGRGNGPDAVSLTFPLDQLGWAGSGLLERDAYLFWIIAEGGHKFGGSMPQFKGILEKDDIWKVILFLKTMH